MKKVIPNLTNTTKENNKQISKIYYYHFVKTFFYFLKERFPSLFIYNALTIDNVLQPLPIIFKFHESYIFRHFFFELNDKLINKAGLKKERAYKVAFNLTRYYFYFNSGENDKRKFNYSWFCKPTELNQILRCLNITNKDFEQFVHLSIEFEKDYNKKVDKILSKRMTIGKKKLS